MALQMYEKVTVLNCPSRPERVGTTGYVLGISEDDEGRLHGYFVMFPDWGQGITLATEWLEGTGEVASRSDFYDDDAPRLRVGVKNGRGFLVEDDK